VPDLPPNCMMAQKILSEMSLQCADYNKKKLLIMKFFKGASTIFYDSL
jgi:hypothetical protein